MTYHVKTEENYKENKERDEESKFEGVDEGQNADMDKTNKAEKEMTNLESDLPSDLVGGETNGKIYVPQVFCICFIHYYHHRFSS